MDIEKDLKEEFGSRVAVERVTHDGTVRFTVYCEADSKERVREELEELEEELSFETY